MSQEMSQQITISVPQMAAVLGISTTVAYTLARRADFPAFQISPHRVVVSRAGLEDWVQKQIKKKE